MRNVLRLAAVAASVSALPAVMAQTGGSVNPFESLTAALAAIIVFWIGRFFFNGFGGD